MYLFISRFINIYFLINVLYFLAWTKYLERRSWIHRAFLGSNCFTPWTTDGLLYCYSSPTSLILHISPFLSLSLFLSFLVWRTFFCNTSHGLVGACFKIVHWVAFCSYIRDIKQSWACGLRCTVSLLRNLHEQGLSDRSALKQCQKDYHWRRARLCLQNNCGTEYSAS